MFFYALWRSVCVELDALRTVSRRPQRVKQVFLFFFCLGWVGGWGGGGAGKRTRFDRLEWFYSTSGNGEKGVSRPTNRLSVIPFCRSFFLLPITCSA
jgi:hypothetical protein